MTTTDKPKLSRPVRYALIVAAVVIFSAGISALVAALGDPAPRDFKVEAVGNVRASWFSESTVGQIDVSTGSGSQPVRANSLTVSVDSTLPEGASCRIQGPNGETYVDHVPANTAARGLAAIVTATCSTK